MNPDALAGMPVNTFLSEYWQKKPLLIRNAFPQIESPVEADVLAGLACEDSVESRLIIRSEDSWDLQHGPFSDEIFSALPTTGWTLLVQAVDHYIPKAAELLELFNFIPRWRIDDLMMSYANNGGGVGPHFDHYDVFLVQTSGQRKWEVGGIYDESSPIRENIPVKILKNFQASDSWILDPGDILYLPPRVGHNGIALGDGCITCSVGFRAPAHNEILREYTDYLGDRLTESSRYQDPELQAQNNTGELSSETIEKFQQILTEYAKDSDAISDWLGRYITTPKYQHANDLELQQSEHTHSLAELKNYLDSNYFLTRSEGSRFAFKKEAKHNTLFVDGHIISAQSSSDGLIELLCNQITIKPKDFSHSEDNLNLLLILLNRNSLYLME